MSQAAAAALVAAAACVVVSVDTSGQALKIASVAVGEGDGVYDLTLDFRLTVPAETYKGNDTGTATIVIGAGP